MSTRQNGKVSFGTLTLVILLFFGILFPLGASVAAKKYLSLGTGSPAGTFYFIGAGFASICNKYVPEVRVIAESTAASEENFHLILRKKMDLGLVAINVLAPALEKKMDLSGVRLLALGHVSVRHWMVRRESPVQSVSDFRGRKVAVGPPGSGTLVASRVALTEVCGLPFDDFKPAYLSFTESITALKDKTVEVGTIAAGYPVASVLELTRAHPIRLISHTEEEIKTLTTKYPYHVRAIIPKGTYPGIDTDTLSAGVQTALFCRQDLSESLAYQLVKAIYDHPGEIGAIHPQAAQWNLENMFLGANYTTQHIPFHPGAVKYLKEKGVWKGR
ncbi:MAG: TAXI family TRAP transporter solute-binding subunit [Thermodesulfobacteriota bacterium]|nr:TAXI family TRAP transporter solute-binding subunit [Thermodesulfobacteriota bacterium]